VLQLPLVVQVCPLASASPWGGTGVSVGGTGVSVGGSGVSVSVGGIGVGVVADPTQPAARVRTMIAVVITLQWTAMSLPPCSVLRGDRAEVRELQPSVPHWPKRTREYRYQVS
jgi:hypothetical protein